MGIDKADPRYPILSFLFLVEVCNPASLLLFLFGQQNIKLFAFIC